MKKGGIADVIRLFKNKRRTNNWRFMSPKTISEELNIPEDRVKRILNRPTNSDLIRRNKGEREIYTLTSFDQ